MDNNNKLMLLDCTLRDGGYINDWNFGYSTSKDIIENLVKAGLDIVEVGFLRNIDKYDKNKTISDNIEALNKLLPNKATNTMFSAMAMQSNYNIDKLIQYTGKGIELIRVTAHDYDLLAGFDYAKKIKEKGYKVSINPINIMGYSDKAILEIIEKVNDINPWQFSVVDTFGSMRKHDLERIIGIVDNNLNKNIRLALHLHENMSLSFSLAQQFIDKNIRRNISVDSSLMGMGRVPGNLPTELIVDYANNYANKNYNTEYIFDAIYNHIAPLKTMSKWGYMPEYFLSAKLNLHRNYAEFFINKDDLTTEDINNLLSNIPDTKKNNFDKEYAQVLYEEYKNNLVDDRISYEIFKTNVKNKTILILAPGKSLKTYKTQIERFIKKENPVVITLNFVSDDFDSNYIFFANNKRYNQFVDKIDFNKLIISSNVNNVNNCLCFNYGDLKGKITQDENSLLLLLKLLIKSSIYKVYIAGADGYDASINYVDDKMHLKKNKDIKYNKNVSEFINNLNIEVCYITPTQYKTKGETNEK